MVSSAERTLHNTFAGVPLDRCGAHRRDAAWLAARRSASSARFLPFDDTGRAPVAGNRLRWLAAADVDANAVTNFLGTLADTPLFALRAPVAQQVAAGATWMGLRAAAAVLDPVEAGLFAYAHALTNWQHVTCYCPRCGAVLALVDGGHRALCPQCKAEQFPRTDAAIIVIVEHGDACLLGRKAEWRARQYSTLAGFVEPGEALVDAVRREVHEETGVVVVDCDYHSSQPWPFPASLMLGFTARAAARAIHRGDGELEDARWFTADQIASGLRDGSLRLPAQMSVAYRLIAHWLRTRAGLELSALARPD